MSYDIAYIANHTGLDGLVCTNTTLDREKVAQNPLSAESGGLSGVPVYQKSNEVLAYLRPKTEKTIIGVGGIASVADAREKMRLGADLIQVYTGFVYEGPGLIKKLVRGIHS